MLVREGWSLGREGGGGAAGSGGRCAELGRVGDAAWLGLRSGVKALRGRARPMVPGLRPELRSREPPGFPWFQATLYAEAIGGRSLIHQSGLWRRTNHCVSRTASFPTLLVIKAEKRT